jgi:coenzyme F420 hydrogenase subunit beta
MIDRIKKYHLCIGCGLCASVLGEEKCKMQLNGEGFYEPKAIQPLSPSELELIKKLCPGIHIEAKAHKGVWGAMISVCEGWAADTDIRHKAASGGVVTSLAICALEQGLVDAVLQVGVRDGSYLYNELKISHSREEVLRNAQSRYAPALVLHRIKEIFDSSAECFAFIGKPCDIAAMKNFIGQFPQYVERVKYYISIFCAGMPSYNATVKTWQMSGHQDEPVSLKYRGDGWPGYFVAHFEDGSNFQLSYNESWGKILGHHVGFRCKICPDGIGMLADVAVGDSWNTKDGYPDFTESDGRCFCIVRTSAGDSLMKATLAKGYIKAKALDIRNIKQQQAYQYKRRKLEGWRLIPVQLMTGGLLHFKGLAIWRQALSANLRVGLRNMQGTYKRIKKING